MRTMRCRHFCTLVTGLLVALQAQLALAREQASKCIQIYYDRVPDSSPPYQTGYVHAIMLENLLGHFPEIQQYIIPIEMYRPNDLGKCGANIYLATFYENRVPQAFYDDYLTTPSTVVWAGYGIWHLPQSKQRSLWGVEFSGLSSLDADHRDADGKPAFYRNFDYKGEVFQKYAEFDRFHPVIFNAAYEISLFDVVDDDLAKQSTLAWARHSFTGDRVPYVLRHDNRWYIGDSPFAFIDEEDRYLIFADLLFDILDEPPRRQPGEPKPALIRLEDVHPLVALWQLYDMVNMFFRNEVKFSMSLIPVFRDPFLVNGDHPANRYVALTSRPYFQEFLKYAKERGGSFIFHGFTHQHDTERNPYNGMTGDDFEFWDRTQNKPVSDDSVNYVVGRLEDGLDLLGRAGVQPVAWLVPHYQASPLDYVIFSQLFSWNVGRIIYFPYSLTQSSRLPPQLAMDRLGAAGRARRATYFQDLAVAFRQDQTPTGQFFPYEIDRDFYAQRLIPENVGNVQPYMNEQVFRVETVDDMIRVLRRNRVLRDSWGSFFIHPFRLETRDREGLGEFPGDTAAVERLINAAKDAGYQFIDLETFIRNYRDHVVKKPVELQVEREGQ